MERRRIEDNEQSAAHPVAEQLRERVIGQDGAVDAIVEALDKARLRDPSRPVANFMFLGPTGTGKTQTAEALADILAVDKLNPLLTRIDCAQYANGHEVAALVGAPPGFVGHEQKPRLEKDKIERPGSVVLFDEIEKGHPKLHNYLLQIMRGGKVKMMNTETEINFSNSVVIMTSNVGAQEMNDTISNNRIGFSTTQEPVDASKVEAAAQSALKKRFSPEFINRLDSIITFNALDDDDLFDVLGVHVERSNSRYRLLGNTALSLSEELTEHLVATAQNRREFGAPPVIRNYEKRVETKLSRMALAGTVSGFKIFADLEDNEVAFFEDGPVDETNMMLALAAYAESADEEDFEEKVKNGKKGRATRS